MGRAFLGRSSSTLTEKAYSDLGFVSQCSVHNLQPIKFIDGQIQLGSCHKHGCNLIDTENTVCHLCRPQIVQGNSGKRVVDITHEVLSGNVGRPSLQQVLLIKAFPDLSQAMPDLPVSIFHNYRDCLSTPLQAQLISLQDELCGVCVLPTHHEYCDRQRGDRADRLHPTGPIRLRELVVVSQYNDVDNAKNYQKCDCEVWVFHALAESCLKGILA